MVEPVKRNIHLPFLEAVHISIEHIRKRQTRSLIVGTSIALGIAYLTYFLTTNIIFGASVEGGTAEAYHFWLVVVSIAVCGIGLINATLISVLERYREIGTMKCLGALDHHILQLLLIEALLFGVSGGVAGLTLGQLIAIISSGLQLGFDVIMQLPWIDMVMLAGPVIGLSVVLTVLSTMYPAIRAARLDPVEALRYDV
ncbi:MAG: FtsX-like permease family protein [Candidatus Bathyarchaeota archaeon]|nr:MAG: FtsX-like permease family protein [Candidatus Bathyarchaeota archaeon]